MGDAQVSVDTGLVPVRREILATRSLESQLIESVGDVKASCVDDHVHRMGDTSEVTTESAVTLSIASVTTLVFGAASAG